MRTKRQLIVRVISNGVVGYVALVMGCYTLDKPKVDPAFAIPGAVFLGIISTWCLARSLICALKLDGKEFEA